MLELLSPAGSPEAVIAAVQNGADAVYLGLGNFNARRGAANFSEDNFEKTVRYCHVRGCKVYVTLNTLVNDREFSEAVKAARFVSGCGADAVLVQDLGLAAAVRRALPDLPIHASTQMSIHNLAGAEAAAQMGITRVVLARELSLEQIRFISKNCSVETEVFVHGALCFSHSGQCYMSALIGRRSGNRGMCAQPCRMQYSLGGRMDNCPLSLKDNCLIGQLEELEAAGVSCVKIEGRMKRPEYSAIVTGIYSEAIKEKRAPTEDELELLQKAFSRSGFTQGYLNGDRQNMFGIRGEPDKESEKIFNEARKNYSTGELRRVPVHFYTIAQKGERVKAVAFDDDGNKAVAEGAMPERARNQSLTVGMLTEQMYKTGGTPYHCVENRAKTDEGLYLPASSINELRRNLLASLSEKRAEAPERRSLPCPEMPSAAPVVKEPEYIYQVMTAQQLTQELAALKPGRVYVPLTELAGNIDAVAPFTEAGTVVTAVLPRVITDSSAKEIGELLKAVFDGGVREALVGNIGHIYLPKSLGMKIRGDFGLNVFNSYTMAVLKDAGLVSATASFELRLSQIRDLAKLIDTEMIVYGRLPLMVSDQCIIRESAGKCNCQKPGQLTDRTGSVFPVVREYGCRNVILNAHKLYLADRKEDIYSAGLAGMRLMFTTESPMECVEVAKSYLGASEYTPNVLTRGLYYRGVD